MSEYTNLISALRKKVGPITLEEILKLQELQTLPADALGPGSVGRNLSDDLTDRRIPVASFGTVDRTGITSSSTAFQAAADSGKPIIVPPGDYLIDEVILPDDADFMGVGKLSNIIAPDIGFILKNRSKVRHFGFSTTGSGNRRGVEFDSSQQVVDAVVEHCIFTSMGRGISYGANSVNTAHTRLKLNFNTFITCDYGIFIERGLRSQIIGNQLFLTGGSSQRGIHVQGCIYGSEIIANNINGGKTGVSILYQRTNASRSVSDVYAVSAHNLIANNYITNVSEESISIDCNGNDPTNCAAREVDTVASVSSLTVTLSAGGWAGITANAHFNDYAGFVTGALAGRIFRITASSGATITLDCTGAEASAITAGDLVVIGAWAFNTVISGNRIQCRSGANATGIMLWGMCQGITIGPNTIEHLYRTSVLDCIGLASLNKVDGTGSRVSTAGRNAPVMGCTVGEVVARGGNINLRYEDYGSGAPDYVAPGNSVVGAKALGNALTLQRQYRPRISAVECGSITIDSNTTLEDAPYAKTSNYTVTSLDATEGRSFTNVGASATVTLALPSAVPGMRVSFYRSASQAFRADPNGSETIGSGGVGKYFELQSNGGRARLECFIAGHWDVVFSSGTTASEP